MRPARRDRGVRRARLACLLATLCCTMVPLVGLTAPAHGATCDPAAPPSCALRDLAPRAGIRIGATAEPSQTLDPAYATTLTREFDSLTPENALKWYATQPTPGPRDFGGADVIVDFALAQGMEVRGHTLLWAQDQYTPGWVKALSDPAALRAAMDDQLTATMEHFAGRIHRWDVVNEPLASSGTGPSASVFWSLGPQWIADAFRLAHATDPSAELWINEYGTDWVSGKHAALLSLVAGLLRDGVPIDGVGIQTHRLPGAVLDQAAFAAQLRDFAALGLDVAITELDVPVSPTDPAALAQQAVEYQKAVGACLAVPRCREVTTWGLSDGSTWLDGLGIFPTPTRPLLFDTDYAPKPAYDAVRALLASATTPPPPTTTSAPPDGPEAGSDPAAPTTTGLARTGTDSGLVVACGLLLLAGGSLMVRGSIRSVRRAANRNRDGQAGTARTTSNASGGMIVPK